MTQPVDVELNLGGDYTDQVSHATQATEGLAAAVNTLQAPSRSVQQALNYATPTRAHIAAWGGFTAAAGYFQSQTAGIRATATAAGQSVRGLDSDVQSIARTFPVGTQGAVEMVQAVQSLSVQRERVRPLAVDFERLAAATNSMSPQMAVGFGQLNRELASLDPQRLARFGDVVTTVSARTGASAMGLISFSQAIAPVAQQAGIGESAILGISSAFVKLGDDGGAAATAVNKILADLNRSVREGSNDMAAYAQITGMTVDKFRQLYQANPAQALAAVTTAIGRAGPRGQMELENLGLEGVRTQRALLQLSQSGGLQTAVNQAVGAYGNGSTQRAAAAALSGLDSSITELRSTAGQTADALGGPFLHILTRITDLAKTGLAPVNALLGSSYGQAGILGAGALAVTGMAARRVLRPLGMFALGRQALTSGPVRGLAGGYALGRTENDLAAVEQMRAGRYGIDAASAYTEGSPYGRGFMQPLNRGFTQAGYTLGRFRTDMSGQPFAAGQAGSGSFLRRAGRAGVASSSMAYEAWLRTFADPYHQATTPAGERVSLLSPREGGLLSQANQVRQDKGIRAALGFLEREGTGSAQALSRMTSATLGASRAVAAFAGRTLEAGAVAGGSALRGIAGSALGLVGGGIGAALLGGTALYGWYRNQQQQQDASRDRMANLDMYGTLNKYRDALGEAGVATVTLADQMQTAAATIAKTVTTMPDARSVTAQDIATNPPSQSKVAHRYVGSASAVAAQISAENLSGMSPQDVEAVKQDLLRSGRRPENVAQILRMINTNPGGVISSGGVRGIVAGAASAAGSHSQSIFHRVAGSHLPGEKGVWEKIGDSITPEIGSNATNTLDLLQGAIMQQYSDLTDHYTQAYAVQSNVRTANAALGQALASGNPDLVASVAQRLGIALTGNKKFKVSAAAVQAAGGDITKLLGKNKIYGQTIGDWMSQGVSALGPVGVPATRIASGDITALQSAGASIFMPFFGNTRPSGQTGRAYDAIGAFEQQPQNAKLQTAAVQQFVSAAYAAGNSLAEIAANANRAIGTTSGGTQTLMQGAYGEAQFQLQRNLIGAGRGAALAQQTAFYGNVATSPAEGPDAQKNIADARQNLLDLQSQEVSFYQQRVMAQYQYQIQVGRSQEDYQKQTRRSEEDFLIGRSRAWRDFNINLSRQVQDASAQMYNPYQRIQAKPVWDAVNLIGNRGEQLSALRRQSANIKELRKLGLSQQTIDQLQLYDPNNAQQVQELVADLQSNRSLIGQLNTQSQQIGTASGQLVTQSPEYRRQRADFERSLNDQQSDFNRQQSRQRTDFAIAMTRMAQDLHTQDLEITGDMTKLTADMNAILAGQTLDLSNQVTSALQNTLASVSYYAPLIQAGLSGTASAAAKAPTTSSGVSATGSVSGGGYGNAPVVSSTFSDTIDPRTGQQVRTGTQTSSYVAPGTGTVYSGAISGTGPGTYDYDPASAFMKAHPADPNYNRSIAKQMMPPWAGGSQWTAWNSLWTRESGWNQYADNSTSDAYGIPQSLPGTKMATAGSDWRTNPATQIKWGIDYIAHRYGTPAKAMAHETKYGWYGDGSVFAGPQVIGVGERGPEAAIPLNARGLEFMVSALRQYVSPTDARAIAATAGTVIIHHEHHHYDQRLDARGSKFDVKASDPKELGQAMLAHERAQNLVATRGVSRGRS